MINGAFQNTSMTLKPLNLHCNPENLPMVPTVCAGPVEVCKNSGKEFYFLLMFFLCKDRCVRG